MIVRYNALNKLDSPTLSLCNPGSVCKNDGTLSNVVGILADHEAEEIVFNFNSTSELNFRINRICRTDKDEDDYALRLFKSVQNRRLVFVDDIGFFSISNVDESKSRDGWYKDVKAESIDSEIAQKNIPYIEDGTYKFFTVSGTADTVNESENADATDTKKAGILNIITSVLPLWTIGNVDDSVAEKYRTFEDVDTSLNCLSFLMDNVQEAYECIFVFDIIHRVINVYDQNNYVKQTSVHITHDDVINSLDISENADDLYTAISVLGSDDVTIAAINPLGTTTIYNFDYYLSWMSDALRDKTTAWQELVKAKKDEYYDASLEYYTNQEKIQDLSLDIQRLDTLITMYTRCKDNIVAEASTDNIEDYNAVIEANNGTKINTYTEIKDTVNEILNLINECERDKAKDEAQKTTIADSLQPTIDLINSIRDELDIQSYFGEYYEELSYYIFEGSYSDDYVAITDIMSYTEKFAQMKTLYDRALKQLQKISSPTQEFSIDTESFIFAKEFSKWSEQLETGCLINVEIEQDDVAQLFLSSMTVNYDDHNLSFTFGNRFNKFDSKSLFDNVLGNISKTANSLNYVKDILYPIKSGQFDKMQETLQTSRNLTMNNALAANDEEVLIDGTGYTGKAKNATGGYSPEQIKITRKNIVFTDDAWNSSKTAIGQIILQNGTTVYGINAEYLIGDMIIGEGIRIFDKDGGELFTIMDNKISSQIDSYNNSVVPGGTRTVSQVLQDSNGLSIRVDNIEKKKIDSVVTSTGYKFDAEGLTIHRENDEMTNLLDHTGMYVRRSGEDVLVANNNGVEALNLISKNYLIIGNNSRFENYATDTDSKRTACYFIDLAAGQEGSDS